MIPSSPSNGLTTECGHSFRQDWSPPAAMREALAAPNFTRIRFEAHSIKGSARQVGADAIADACEELETISDLQDALLIAARLNCVQELFEDIRGAMASYSNSRKLALR